jgi:hypothetical protein
LGVEPGVMEGVTLGVTPGVVAVRLGTPCVIEPCNNKGMHFVNNKLSLNYPLKRIK